MFIGLGNQKAILDTGCSMFDGKIQQPSSKMVRNRARTIQRRGFTLLEITLAVAILATMSLAIYRFVQSNLIALRASSDASVADARYSGLRDLLLAQWQ